MAVSVSFPNKDPEEVLDYSLDFSDWLVEGADVDNVPAMDVTVESMLPDESPSTLVIDNVFVSASPPIVSIWLSGGTVGTKYIIKVLGTDDQTPERTYVRRASIKIRYK